MQFKKDLFRPACKIFDNQQSIFFIIFLLFRGFNFHDFVSTVATLSGVIQRRKATQEAST